MQDACHDAANIDGQRVRPWGQQKSSPTLSSLPAQQIKVISLHHSKTTLFIEEIESLKINVVFVRMFIALFSSFLSR